MWVASPKASSATATATHCNDSSIGFCVSEWPSWVFRNLFVGEHAMANQWLMPFKFMRMMLMQIGPQRLERIPEPQAITNADENVLQYDKVMQTKLVLAYAAGLQMIHRTRDPIQGGS